MVSDKGFIKVSDLIIAIENVCWYRSEEQHSDLNDEIKKLKVYKKVD